MIPIRRDKEDVVHFLLDDYRMDVSVEIRIERRRNGAYVGEERRMRIGGILSTVLNLARSNQMPALASEDVGRPRVRGVCAIPQSSILSVCDTGVRLESSKELTHIPVQARCCALSPKVDKLEVVLRLA